MVSMFSFNQTSVFIAVRGYDIHTSENIRRYRSGNNTKRPMHRQDKPGTMVQECAGKFSVSQVVK